MSNNPKLYPFADLQGVATHLRKQLTNKKYILLFAYNRTGKTRLSMEFKEQGKQEQERDTLYYNAFTEDLFSWDNDLEHDTQRVLRINQDSKFCDGLRNLEMESRIGPILERYAHFNFFIDYDTWTVSFEKEVKTGEKLELIEHIKISRGEENIFIWSFFLAIAQIAIDHEEGFGYDWVKYIYIDDPISSLDDNNAITVANHLGQLLKNSPGDIKTIISTHHSLFFNVIWNELNKEYIGKIKASHPYFLSSNPQNGGYTLHYTKETPFFHHVALVQQLHEAVQTNQLQTYHFGILRNILEKSAMFHGFEKFSDCIKKPNDDNENILYARMINVLSHGKHALFESNEMPEEYKIYFDKILRNYLQTYKFNPELFKAKNSTEADS